MANVHLPPNITNLVHIPYILGKPTSNPDTHVAKFEITCASNDIPTAKIQEVFTASLQEDAFAWYQRQPPFAYWNASKTTFLAHFRPLGITTSLKEKLCTVKMGINEKVDTYYGRMQDILQRMGNHQIPNVFLVNIYIGGLYHIELRTYIKEGATATYVQAYVRAKIWEECTLENELVIYIDNTYSNNLIPLHFGTFLNTENNRHYVIDAPYMRNTSAPLYTPSMISKPPQPNPVNDKYDNAIWNRTKQLSKLSISVTNNRPKRPQPTEENHNVWCYNCKGQGHLANECPTRNGFRTKCILCGGNHTVQECRNLKQQKVVNQVDINQSRHWQQEQNGPGPSANYSPKINFNHRPVPLSFQGRPNWNQPNYSSHGNGPPSYNQNYNFFDSNPHDLRKYPVCYRCKELML